MPSRMGNYRTLRSDWTQRLDYIVDTMREMSLLTDPQEMVRTYGDRMELLIPSDAFAAVSRRNLAAPKYRITRSGLFEDGVNPWKQWDKLPLFDSGLLGELIYGEQTVVIDHLEVAESDPAYRFMRGMKSLVAIPQFDNGRALNMVVRMSRRPRAFDHATLPETTWLINLFGRATQNLVLNTELGAAYETVDRELKAVADIQRSLLPAQFPRTDALELAAHYETSQRAGGDYYDFFELPDGKLGLFIADVAGHGTPAAVMMAVTHSIAHTHDGPPTPPCSLMRYLNEHLTARYTGGGGTFVTAFYCIFDPRSQELTYCSAGHCPPRVRDEKGRSPRALDAARHLPLGIDFGERYEDSSTRLDAGDSLVLYTDGITEARGPGGDLFGVERLDSTLGGANHSADDLVGRIRADVNHFCDHRSPTDDRTILVARVTGDKSST